MPSPAQYTANRLKAIEVNLSIYEHLHPAMKNALRQLKELQAERRCTAGGLAGGVLLKPKNGFVLQKHLCGAGGLAGGELPKPENGFVLQKHSPRRKSILWKNPIGFVLKIPEIATAPRVPQMNAKINAG
jgi:hypothetical protein